MNDKKNSQSESILLQSAQAFKAADDKTAPRAYNKQKDILH